MNVRPLLRTGGAGGGERSLVKLQVRLVGGHGF